MICGPVSTKGVYVEYLSTMSSRTEKEQVPIKNISPTLYVIHTVVDSLILILKILYFIGESVYEKCCPPALKDIRGKIVVITGTGHGIGRELAHIYSSEGAVVVGWDVNEIGNKETFQQIRGKSFYYNCDVSDRNQVLETASKVQEEVGEVDILINNAGIMPCHRLLDHTPEAIEEIFKVNVFGHIWTLEAFLPNMIARNSGHVVALSSCAGLFGLKNLVPYCASKFSVTGLMESLYQELKDNAFNNVRLTTVFPYMTNTGLCHKPKIRFENAMRMLEPIELAKEIMRAQRADKFQVSVPGYLMNINNYTRLLPPRAQDAVQNFLSAYVEAE